MNKAADFGASDPNNEDRMRCHKETSSENTDDTHLKDTESDITEFDRLTPEQLFAKLTPIDDAELANIDIDAVVSRNIKRTLPKYPPEDDSDEAVADSLLDYIYEHCLDDFVTNVSVDELTDILCTNEENVIKGFRYIYEHYRPLPFDIYFTDSFMTIVNRPLFSQYIPW